MVRVFLGGLKGILMVNWVLVGCSELSPGCCYGVLNGYQDVVRCFIGHPEGLTGCC